ncbi:NAD(P)/FAD-dependent oxidoreductase [Siculibacillus lacustris]|nr:FAD-binding oxidoreductase [Siculibacillus lacustris]
MPHTFDRIPSDEILPARADVVVIGAGIIGVTAALELARAGLSVALVEKGWVAAEQSSRNWGWVRQQGRDRREIPLIVESLAIWDRLQAESPVDLGFRRTGLVSLTRSPDELARWRRWAVRGRAGGIVVEDLSADEAEAAFPSRGAPWIGGLRTPTDGRAEPAVAVPAIAALARAAGVGLHQETAVRGIEIDAGNVTGVVTERGRIATSKVLVAGGAWSSQLLRRNGIRLPQLNLRSTVIRTTPAPELISGALMSQEFCLRRRLDGGFTLTLRGDESSDVVVDAFRFLRPFLPGLLREFRAIKLRFGTRFFVDLARWWPRPLDRVSAFEEERVSDPAPDPAVIRKALAAFKRNRPEVAGVAPAEAWAGRIDATPDGVPVISTVATVAGLTIATGFCGHGFGIGPGAGRLAADLVRGTAPIVDPTPFRLSRFDDGTPIFLDPDVI